MLNKKGRSGKKRPLDSFNRCFILHNEQTHLLCSRLTNNVLNSNLALGENISAAVTRALKGFHGANTQVFCVQG